MSVREARLLVTTIYGNHAIVTLLTLWPGDSLIESSPSLSLPPAKYVPMDGNSEEFCGLIIAQELLNVPVTVTWSDQCRIQY